MYENKDILAAHVGSMGMSFEPAKRKKKRVRYTGTPVELSRLPKLLGKACSLLSLVVT